jgi:hypothetical protein
LPPDGRLIFVKNLSSSDGRRGNLSALAPKLEFIPTQYLYYRPR